MFENIGDEITQERNKLETALEGEAVHISAVIHKLLVKLNLAVEADVTNGKAYIKALAENGIDDLTHKPPAVPAPAEHSTSPEATEAAAPVANGEGAPASDKKASS